MQMYFSASVRRKIRRITRNMQDVDVLIGFRQGKSYGE